MTEAFGLLFTYARWWFLAAYALSGLLAVATRHKLRFLSANAVALLSVVITVRLGATDDLQFERTLITIGSTGFRFPWDISSIPISVCASLTTHVLAHPPLWTSHKQAF